jgi:hypothetical protein
MGVRELHEVELLSLPERVLRRRERCVRKAVVDSSLRSGLYNYVSRGAADARKHVPSTFLVGR